MSKISPKLVAIAGPNGAGKTTLAPLLLRDSFGLMEYVNADPIALGLSGFRPENASFQAGRIMLSRMHELARQKKSFAFETTLASRTYAPWVRDLLNEGYTFHLLFLWLQNPSLAARRVKERVRMGGHVVDEPIIRRRYQRGLKNFFELYQPLAKTWAMYDNSLVGHPDLVASGSPESKITVMKPELWKKIKRS